MTRLLVSVRSAAEAEIALAAGADLIDCKEPARGALGACDPTIVRDVAHRVAGRVPTSAALGELLDFSPALARALPAALHYAKWGLAGCRARDDWPQRLAQAWRELPSTIAPVAVVYADDERAAAPRPQAILDFATAQGGSILLVDTWEKRAGQDLFDCWPLAELAPFVAQAKQRGLRVVLAGSLGPERVEQVCALAPDYLGVRGAVCTTGREGALDARKIRALQEAIAAKKSAFSQRFDQAFELLDIRRAAP